MKILILIALIVPAIYTQFMGYGTSAKVTNKNFADLKTVVPNMVKINVSNCESINMTGLSANISFIGTKSLKYMGESQNLTFDEVNKFINCTGVASQFTFPFIYEFWDAGQPHYKGNGIATFLIENILLSKVFRPVGYKVPVYRVGDLTLQLNQISVQNLTNYSLPLYNTVKDGMNKPEFLQQLNKELKQYLIKLLEAYYDQTAATASSYYTYCFYRRNCYSFNVTRISVDFANNLLVDIKDGTIVNKRIQNFSRPLSPADFNSAKFGGAQTLLAYSTVNHTFWNMRLDGYLNVLLNRRNWNGPFGYTIGEVSYAIPSVLTKYRANELCWGVCKAAWVNQFRMSPSTPTSEGYFDVSINYRCNLTKDTIRPRRTSVLLLGWNVTVSFKVYAQAMSTYINFIAKQPVASNIKLIPAMNFTLANPEVAKMYVEAMVAKLNNARVWGSGMKDQPRTSPATYFFNDYLVAYDKKN